MRYRKNFILHISDNNDTKNWPLYQWTCNCWCLQLVKMKYLNLQFVFLSVQYLQNHFWSNVWQLRRRIIDIRLSLSVFTNLDFNYRWANQQKVWTLFPLGLERYRKNIKLFFHFRILWEKILSDMLTVQNLSKLR